MNMSRIAALVLVALLCAEATMGQSRSWRDRDRGTRTERSDSGERSDRRSESDSDGFSDEYGLIVDQNIFIRNRGRRPEPVRTITTRPVIPTRTPEQSLMLTGIVIEEGELRAYFENLPTGTIQRVGIGEPIGRGHIIEIMIDAVAYASDSSVQWVEIGHDLTGTPAAAMSSGSGIISSSSSTSTTGETGGTATGAAPTDTANMSLAEQMRERARRLRGGN
jgi:hypothetical protein